MTKNLFKRIQKKDLLKLQLNDIIFTIDSINDDNIIIHLSSFDECKKFNNIMSNKKSDINGIIEFNGKEICINI